MADPLSGAGRAGVGKEVRGDGAAQGTGEGSRVPMGVQNNVKCVLHSSPL